MEVEVERVAELVGLGVVGALVADAERSIWCWPILSLVSLENRSRQGVRADLADALRRQLEPALLVLDEAGLLQHAGQLGQALERAGGVVAEQVADPVDVGLGQRAGLRRAAQQVLELVEVAELLHHARMASAKPSGSWPSKS